MTKNEQNTIDMKTDRDFDQWFEGLRSSNTAYDTFRLPDNVYEDIDKLRPKLAIMGSLIGSKNIEDDFKELATNHPEIMSCIPLLVAVRKKTIPVSDEGDGFEFHFNKKLDVEMAARFMRRAGIFDILEKLSALDILSGYVMGSLGGLSSSGRKNRNGKTMEADTVEFIEEAGLVKDVNYFPEMYIHEIEEKFEVDLSPISNNGTTEKRFDFVARAKETLFLIETNFYNTGGSKLNETARSYKMLAQEVKDIDGVEFIWVTDGKGWKSARNNLKETFDAQVSVYNLSDLENGAFKELFGIQD